MNDNLKQKNKNVGRNRWKLKISFLVLNATIHDQKRYRAKNPGTTTVSGFFRAQKYSENKKITKLVDCDIVFLDPDNGLNVKSVKPGSPKSPKYVWLHEASDYIASGKSVIFYNHRPRKKAEAYAGRAGHPRRSRRRLFHGAPGQLISGQESSRNNPKGIVSARSFSLLLRETRAFSA